MATFSSAAGVVAWRALLTGLLVAGCVTDVRARRIPNVLVLTVAGTALAHAALAAWAGAPAAGFATGPGTAGLGALAGLALWLPLYAVGAFGAGDVKLFAAVAAWLGPTNVPSATLYAALAGGGLGLMWLGARRLAHLAPAGVHAAVVDAGRSRVPYGLAITAGVLAVVWRAP